MITLDPETLGQLDVRESVATPRAYSPPPTRGSGPSLPKAADGRAYARLSRLERLRLDGRADEGDEAAVSSTPNWATSADAEDPEQDKGAAVAGKGKDVKERFKMRGKNSAMKRYLRKQKQNVIDPNMVSCQG